MYSTSTNQGKQWLWIRIRIVLGKLDPDPDPNPHYNEKLVKSFKGSKWSRGRSQRRPEGSKWSPRGIVEQ
jgi:hypothetical protein